MVSNLSRPGIDVWLMSTRLYSGRESLGTNFWKRSPLKTDTPFIQRRKDKIREKLAVVIEMGKDGN
jgi:hypothetical protein